jgi:hypothetical protein
MFSAALYARVRFFYPICTRDRGCGAHPAFPAPSCLRDNETQTSGASRREIKYVYLVFEIESNFPLVIASSVPALGPTLMDETKTAVIARHSRPKDGVASARL